MQTKTLTCVIYDTLDQAINITAEYSPGCSGHRDKYGAPEEPDTEGSIEILMSLDDNKFDVVLTPDQHAEAIAKLWEEVGNE